MKLKLRLVQSLTPLTTCFGGVVVILRVDLAMGVVLWVAALAAAWAMVSVWRQERDAALVERIRMEHRTGMKGGELTMACGEGGELTEVE